MRRKNKGVRALVLFSVGRRGGGRCARATDLADFGVADDQQLAEIVVRDTWREEEEERGEGGCELERRSGSVVEGEGVWIESTSIDVDATAGRRRVFPPNRSVASAAASAQAGAVLAGKRRRRNLLVCHRKSVFSKRMVSTPPPPRRPGGARFVSPNMVLAHKRIYRF